MRVDHGGRHRDPGQLWHTDLTSRSLLVPRAQQCQLGNLQSIHIRLQHDPRDRIRQTPDITLTGTVALTDRPGLVRAAG